MGKNTVSVYGGGSLERIPKRPTAFSVPQPKRAPQPRPSSPPPATFGDRTPQSPAEGGTVKMSDERRAELLGLTPEGRALLAAEMKAERGEVDDLLGRMVNDGIISEEEGERRRQLAKRGGGAMSAERRRELLRHTALGRTILREEDEAARTAGK